MNKTDAAEILQMYVFADEECIAQDMKDYNEALKMAIEALSESNLHDLQSGDLISRKEVINYARKCADGYSYIELPIDVFVDGISPLSADTIQGKWIDKGWKGDWQFETDGRGNCWYEYECSECGFRNKGSKSNFCPNCGADMRGDTE